MAPLLHWTNRSAGLARDCTIDDGGAPDAFERLMDWRTFGRTPYSFERLVEARFFDAADDLTPARSLAMVYCLKCQKWNLGIGSHLSADSLGLCGHKSKIFYETTDVSRL
jgi:hypothetical protein